MPCRFANRSHASHQRLASSRSILRSRAIVVAAAWRSNAVVGTVDPLLPSSRIPETGGQVWEGGTDNNDAEGIFVWVTWRLQRVCEADKDDTEGASRCRLDIDRPLARAPRRSSAVRSACAIRPRHRR